MLFMIDIWLPLWQRIKSSREMACARHKIDEWSPSIGEWGKKQKAPFEGLLSDRGIF
jgi:hypothetical protein